MLGLRNQYYWFSKILMFYQLTNNEIESYHDIEIKQNNHNFDRILNSFIDTDYFHSIIDFICLSIGLLWQITNLFCSFRWIMISIK